MIIRNHHITMNTKEISDSLVHTAPGPYRWFIITAEMTPLESFHKAERIGAGTSLVSSLMRNLLFCRIAYSH